MSKRSVTEIHTSSGSQTEPRKTPRGESKQREQAGDDEMGEFEDAWEDELESDEEVVDAEAGKDEDGASVSIMSTS